jgi:signal transduction histidine kinase
MRLNNKTIRSYLFYSCLIYLLTIPLFYFVMRSVLQHAVDKSLRSQLKEIRSNLGEIHSQEELAAWSKMDKDILLSPTDEAVEDRIYSTTRYSPKHGDEEPYREIAGTINVEGKMYRIVISSSLIENDDLLGSILLVQSIVLFLLICGMLWINQRISKRLWQPFYVALRNMQQFELNKQTDLPFLASTTDEFNELNKAIKNLFSRSSEIYLHQKEFTENASHEMQTPLAIYQSKLELLMQTSPLSEEQAELINVLDDTNRRLIKLNKSLLLLTKIENNQYQDVYDVEITALCKKLIQQLQSHAQEKNIVIHGDFPDTIVVRVNNVLIEILIGNLLSNAIRYNIDNGTIVVRTERDALVIGNTGVPVPLSSDKVFTRFYKQTGPAGSEDSTGLGLAIVKNICTLYNYTISYAFIEGRHTFRLGFHDGAVRQGAGS